ncbi:glycosyltransferase [Alkalinema sp. FACHB-956]|uniref:glycosyltransferase n=1 Tax=Alkalinema sp. FACHB-956 TaxID=2692768 RepID=UPI00168462C1|nr:tetratricopeptide repeat protein [Alkalinema sp. FACHB-956]
MSLSLCMIVKNEAANLPRCLDSVKDVVDEMIVLDTGSTDQTIAIAQSYGAKVYEFTWCDDFSAARNAALPYVTGEWVLVLDADEVLLPAIVPALTTAIQNSKALVINLVRQEVGAPQAPYSLVSRLFRKHPAIYFQRPYHAMIDDSVETLLQQESHWEIINLPDIAIWHDGYQPEMIAARDKWKKARTTMEGFLAQHPNDPYVCSKLGALYIQMGETTRGIELLQRGLQAETIDVSTRYELHYHLGSVYQELQEPLQADEQYQQAMQQPILPMLKLGALHNWAALRQTHGDLETAKLLYEQALAIAPDFTIAHYNLGMTLRALGDLAGAIGHYQTAIQLQPDYADAYQNLGVVLLKIGDGAGSRAAFQQAIALHQQQGSPEAQRLQQSLRDLGML